MILILITVYIDYVQKKKLKKTNLKKAPVAFFIKKKTPRIFAIPDENASGWQITWLTYNLKFAKTFWTASTYLIWGKRRSRPNR